MDISTDDGTRPGMPLYYAIMLGGLGLSLIALFTLSWSVFVIVALVSTGAVIAAAWGLGIVGPQIVDASDPPQTTSLTWKRAWMGAAIIAALGVSVAHFFVPPDWQGRVGLLGYLGFLAWFAFRALVEARRAVSGRHEGSRGMVITRLAVLLVGVLVLSGTLLVFPVMEMSTNGSSILLGLLIFLSLRSLAGK